MNPVVKSHQPRDMFQRLEGKGVPIWRWLVGDVTCVFFASSRDFEQYTQADEFYSLSMPDRRGLLALLPAGGATTTVSNPVASWLREQGKLAFAQVPQLLSDFLLSAAGEIATVLPGDFRNQMQRFKEDRSDVLLSRKAGIYSDAMDEIVAAVLPRPRHFCDQDPPDADNTWGSSKIADRATAVCSLALAFTDLTAEHKAILSNLRELFKGGREGRGAGDLNKLRPRGGTVSLADDLLPRSVKGKQAVDAPAVVRLQSYWSRQDRDSLSQLARLLPRQHFLKLVSDEDRKRILESLWRSTQQDFTFEGSFSSVIDASRQLRGQILPALEEAHVLEATARRELGLTGLDFAADEVFVKARDGFRELAEIIDRAARHPDSAGTSLVHALVPIFVNALDVSIHIRSVQAQCASAVRSMDLLTRTAENLIRNFYEFPEAMRFAGISTESILSDYTTAQLSIRQTVDLRQLGTEIDDRQERISQVADYLKRLQESLQELRSVLEGDSTGE